MTSYERIWYRDIDGFVACKNWTRIWFKKDDSVESKLNSIMRFAMYYTILLAVLLRKSWSLVIAVTAGLVTYTMYESSKGETTTATVADANRATASQSAREQPAQPVQPTFNNPYMNRLPFEPQAKRGNADDVRKPKVKQSMRAMHDSGVPYDARDIFGRNTSERVFYTMPVTDGLGGDQMGFAKWLFDVHGDCPTWKERAVLFHR